MAGELWFLTEAVKRELIDEDELDMVVLTKRISML
jgi:hypothetical protein